MNYLVLGVWMNYFVCWYDAGLERYELKLSRKGPYLSNGGNLGFMPYSLQSAIYNLQMDIKDQAGTNIVISIDV